MTGCRYVVALGSNQRHHRHGRPRDVLSAAIQALAGEGLVVEAASGIVTTSPLGPARRRYANAAVRLRASMAPDALLVLLKGIEHRFGRRRGGRRWASRVLDLDIILWESGPWRSPGLTVPHASFRERNFVLGPAVAIAPSWRDPLTALTLQQLHARLTQRHPLPIATSRANPVGGP